MSDTAKEVKDYTAIKEFSVKHNVPTSTLYYMLNRNLVKLKLVSTKYGQRKKFSESKMVEALKERLLL